MTRQTFLRKALGNSTYRVLTQTPRLISFILHPKYEPEAQILPQLVKHGMTCFDIGANYGFYARLLSPLAGRMGKVYSFEPSSITCAGLKLVKRVLGLRNVTVTQCALSEAPGQLTLTIPIKKHGGLGIALAHLGQSLDREGITETVAVKTLDGFLQENNITACDFLKCDVEGAEMLVLKGGTQTIAKFKPIMLLEIDASYLRRNNHTIEQMNELLRGYGYSFHTLENGALKQADGLVDMRNNFLIPSSK